MECSERYLLLRGSCARTILVLCASVFGVGASDCAAQIQSAAPAAAPTPASAAAPAQVTYEVGDVYLPNSRAYVFVSKTGFGHEHGVVGQIKQGRINLDAAGEAGVLVTANVGGAADAEVNALQRLARVALAADDDPGALEAAWKLTPSATDGERIAALIADPGEAVAAGRAARERVREHHLVTRQLLDELNLYARITSGP